MSADTLEIIEREVIIWLELRIYMLMFDLIFSKLASNADPWHSILGWKVKHIQICTKGMECHA